jgi:hypothetical protein
MTDQAKTISLHISQPGEVDYNPRKPLPYPIFVGEDLLCENVPGHPLVREVTESGRRHLPKLVGFQRGEQQSVVLWADDFLANTDRAVGLRPVFVPAHGGMFTLNVSVTSVGVTEMAR